MADTALPSTAHFGGRPIYLMLVPFPIACFVGTLLTDIAYFSTAEMMWTDFSAWLVTVGVILGYLTAIAWLIDALSNRTIRTHTGSSAYVVIGNAVALVLATINMLVHTHDAWTSVVPWGLALSAIVVVILLFTRWAGGSAIYRQDVGVAQ